MPTLTISEWHELAREGSAPPMRIQVHGNSMYPMIRINRDYVTIRPPEDRPEAGDIVLFADPPRSRYVLHRVWQTDGDRVLTWGDNCLGPDGWIPLDLVWGRVTLIERGRRTICPDRASGLRLARIWHPAVRVRHFAGRDEIKMEHKQEFQKLRFVY